MEFRFNLHHSRFVDTFPYNSGIEFADLSEVIPAPEPFFAALRSGANMMQRIAVCQKPCY